MKFHKVLQGLVVITAFSMGATALYAQEYSVFAMGSISSLLDKRYYSEHTIPYGSSYKTGGDFTLGAEAPLKKSKILGVEGSYSRVRNNLAITDYGLSTPSETGYGIHDQRLSGDLVAHAPRYFLGLKPYLVAGLEYDRFSPTYPRSNIFNGFVNAALGSANKAGISYGGGLDMKLLPYLNLRLDVRDHLTSTPTYGLPSSSSNGPYYPISGPAHDVEYSAGIALHFGK
jgi:opacity protein-like surface antigen